LIPYHHLLFPLKSPPFFFFFSSPKKRKEQKKRENLLKKGKLSKGEKGGEKKFKLPFNPRKRIL
jgi:hypothetical protein